MFSSPATVLIDSGPSLGGWGSEKEGTLGLEPQASHISSPRRLAIAAALAGATAVAAFVISPAGAQAPDGAQVYATAGCSGCHGANGEGGIGPALAGNADLANAAAVLA